MLEREMAIKTTFTYDKSKDEIGWFNPKAHRSEKPTIRKRTVYCRPPYTYCTGRGGKQYKTDLIKSVLGELNG